MHTLARTVTSAGVSVFMMVGQALAQGGPGSAVVRPALCRAPDALNLFSMAVRYVLRAQRVDPDWPVFQVPCDTVTSASDASTSAILVVDRTVATDQDVLQYGYTPFQIAETPPPALQPGDPFARLGRLILRPSLAAVPSIWTRGPLDGRRTAALRLAAAAGAVQSLAGFGDAMCTPNESRVPEQLLTAAEIQSRGWPDYHLYFEAALREHHVRLGQTLPLADLVNSVAQDLATGAVAGLRCDLTNRDRFSLGSMGGSVSALTRAAVHIERAIDGLRTTGRSDLGRLNLARTCVLDAVNDMMRNGRRPTCNAPDYGLWTNAYAPLLHAAEVKALEASRR